MRLAIVLTQPFWYDGNSYTTRFPFASFIIGLAHYVDHLTVLAPVRSTSTERGDYAVELPSNAEIIPGPFFVHLSELYMKCYQIIPRYTEILKQRTNEWDVCGLFGSDILSFGSYLILKKARKRTFLYIRANVLKFYPHQIPSKLGMTIGYSLAVLEEILCRIMVRKVPVFAVGTELYERYKKYAPVICEFYTNLISNKDLVEPRISDVCPRDDKIRLLYVGRLIRQKGLEYLIEAVEDIVKQKDYRVNCKIVGEGVHRESLQRMVERKGLGECFSFVGNVDWGHNLFEFYRKSDLFLSVSITEGFPKTIFEAMNLGTPVIATDVGGISGIIKNGYNGVLIKPRSKTALVQAIVSICSDNDLYARIAKNAYDTAREFTVDKQCMLYRIFRK